MKTLTLLLTCMFLLAAGSSSAESWAERAGRLNRREISDQEARRRSDAGEIDRRNKVALRRIKPAMKTVDWDADPTAVPYMLYQINKRTGLPVHIDNEGLDVATGELFDYTVAYLTAHTSWILNEKEVENLSRWLENGGTLILDDCYNRGSAFSESYATEVAKLIPGAEPRLLLEEDPRVADVFRMVYDCAWPGRSNTGENRLWHYFLMDDRPAVLFSPNDDGCAWEVSTPPTASNPLGEPIGHGGGNRHREWMYQLAANWMLFVYTH